VFTVELTDTMKASLDKGVVVVFSKGGPDQDMG